MFVCSPPCECVRCAGSGDKLGWGGSGAFVCFCWLVCGFLMGLLTWGGCAGDLWPFVTLSEWEERGRDAESERERFLNSA